jgi:hypothetical protein
MHWKKVDSDKVNNDWNHFLQFVSTLPSGQLWRHNQAGDLPGIGENIDKQALSQLINANIGKRGFTYTHKPLTPDNLKWIQYANNKGFTINISADSIVEAVNVYKELRLPVTITMSDTFPLNQMTALDTRFQMCPAMIEDHITCKMCQWCAMPDRKWIVMFKAHGSKRKGWK